MSGYAVVDVETTGFSPKLGDRIVEVAIVILDDQLQVAEEWSTLVNPHRDVGPTRVHGITAADVLDAPAFREVAPYVASRLAGRVVVAHNAEFDLRFLSAELGRAGMWTPDPWPCVCTMRWSGHFVPASSRKLKDVCAAVGISHEHAHSAMGDVHSTVELLRHYCGCCEGELPWRDELDRAAATSWQGGETACGVPACQRRGTRPAVDATWLDALTSGMPRENDPAVDAYLELLERAMLDRHLSIHEQQGLIELAVDLGLSMEQLRDVHFRYLQALADLSVADALVTRAERAELEAVAQLLGFTSADVERALGDAVGADADTTLQLRLQPGQRVCFTGALAKPREEWIRLIEAGGLEFAGVSRKTAAVVAADPDSLSGKARKARELGIPLVTEAAFSVAFQRMLGEQMLV